jgi:hypothetical protein
LGCAGAGAAGDWTLAGLATGGGAGDTTTGLGCASESDASAPKAINRTQAEFLAIDMEPPPVTQAPESPISKWLSRVEAATITY